MIGEQQALSTQQLAKHPVLLLQILDDVLLTCDSLIQRRSTSETGAAECS
jgi:hypothetical protein